MRTSKSNSPLFMFVLVMVITFAFLLSVMVPEVHAQEGNPPPTEEPKIVGGGPSTPGEWPWQVALTTGTATGPNFWPYQICGGSLIHPQWVLTAAHCITDGAGNVVAASSRDIVAGIYNLSSPAAGYQHRDVIQIIRHPSYTGSPPNYDVALLKLASPVTIGGSGETTTALVPLAPSGIGDLTGTSSWVTGWGNTETGVTRTDQLYEVSVPIIANSVCNDANHYNGLITGNMLCAGYDAGGFDSCQGDSGGPLVVFNSGQWKLAGIVSWGFGCADPFKPGVYTRVSQFGAWVNQNIGLTTLIAPSGSIGTNYNPTYSWNAVPTMTYYYLYVNGPSGNVIAQWYTAAAAGCGSGTGTCSVTPSTTLAGGAHRWWVQTWNPAGYGPWSVGVNFNTDVPNAPGKATLVSPNGTIATNNPTYVWNTVSDATWYYLYVSGPSGYVFTNWYQASVCSGGTCSVSNATPGLATGAYKWWIQTWNNTGGYGPWSTGMDFGVQTTPPPGAATLVSPSGAISDNTPTYTWNKVNAATWYYLYVSGPSGFVFTQWYQSSVCPGSTCSATPGVSLGGGAYRWWIQTWNSGGYGPWSAGMNFSLPTTGGFDSQFNGSSAGWQPTSGSWFIESSAYYSSPGLPNAWVSTSYNNTFSTLDYQTRLWRTGSNTNVATCLTVRGSPTPPTFDYDWDSGYSFCYTMGGSYSVWKSAGGAAWSALQGYTPSGAINTGAAWNVVRIVANGSSLYLYINGSLVWSGSDASLASGRVGIEFYSPSPLGGDQLWVDWATLSTTAPFMITDTISPEQQTLNDSAQESAGDRNRSLGGKPVE